MHVQLTFNAMRNRLRRWFVVLLIGLVMASSSTMASMGTKAWGQCGNYVIMLDEHGQPILDSSSMTHGRIEQSWQSTGAARVHAMLGVTGRHEFLPSGANGDQGQPHTGTRSNSEPCHGPQCRQRASLPSVPPATYSTRLITDQALLNSGSADAQGEWDAWCHPADESPIAGLPVFLDRPPRGV